MAHVTPRVIKSAAHLCLVFTFIGSALTSPLMGPDGVHLERTLDAPLRLTSNQQPTGSITAWLSCRNRTCRKFHESAVPQVHVPPPLQRQCPTRPYHLLGLLPLVDIKLPMSQLQVIDQRWPCPSPRPLPGRPSSPRTAQAHVPAAPLVRTFCSLAAISRAWIKQSETRS